MDIEIYQDGEYVRTVEDTDWSEQQIFKYLCNFCKAEGYSLGVVERSIIRDSARELARGDEISLCGFDLKMID